MQINGKRVLVTGGAGFLGSHLVDHLRQRAPSQMHVPRRATFDLTSQESTRRLFAEARPDIVFHLAANVGGIGANQRSPASFFHDNMMMGANVLEQSRMTGVRKVILVGTVCSYPKLAPIPFKEDDLWAGYPEETNAAYGIAKRALFTLAEAYRQQHGLSSVCLLPVNLYGPRDNFDLETSHVVPAIIRKFTEAKKSGKQEVVLWGDGEATREFLYVDDCARALILAAERYESSEPVNIGTGQEIRIRALASLLADMTGFRGTVVWDRNRPNGQPRRWLDTSRARERFGFNASVSLEQGLAQTVKWYNAQQVASSERSRS